MNGIKVMALQRAVGLPTKAAAESMERAQSQLRGGMTYAHVRGVLPSTRQARTQQYRAHATTAAAESAAALMLVERSGLSQSHQTYKAVKTLSTSAKELLAAAGPLEREGRVITHGSHFSDARYDFRRSADALLSEASTADRIGGDGEAVLEGLVHRLRLEQGT